MKPVLTRHLELTDRTYNALEAAGISTAREALEVLVENKNIKDLGYAGKRDIYDAIYGFLHTPFLFDFE